MFFRMSSRADFVSTKMGKYNKETVNRWRLKLNEETVIQYQPI